MFEYWLVPLIVGITILGVLYYLNLGSRRLMETLQSLYQLNLEVDQDPLEFIERSWPVLKSAGFSGLSHQTVWFGETLSKHYGEEQPEPVNRSIDAGEMQTILNFYPASSRGEQRILCDLLINTYMLIISSDFSARRRQISKTTEQLSRQQLFAQHDAKNLAQFITLLDEQLAQSDRDSDKLQLLDHIKTSMPVVVERARRLNPKSAMTDHDLGKASLELSRWLSNLARALNIQLEVQGDVRYVGPEQALYEAMKNVLENFRQHTSHNPIVHARLEHDHGNLSILILSDKSEDMQLPPVERMFEPFFTTSKSGMGLGLYLARTALAKLSADIHFHTTEGQYGFLIHIPRQQDGE
jgi:signal transduction histidine kinase